MTECFDCGDPATERHHVVPRSLGGKNTVSLCHNCHGKIHGQKRLNISELTKIGLAKARALGKMIGGRPKYKKRVVNLIKSLYGKKIAIREIARRTNVPYSTVRSILEREICKDSDTQ